MRLDDAISVLVLLCLSVLLCMLVVLLFALPKQIANEKMNEQHAKECMELKELHESNRTIHSGD